MATDGGYTKVKGRKEDVVVRKQVRQIKENIFYTIVLLIDDYVPPQDLGLRLSANHLQHHCCYACSRQNSNDDFKFSKILPLRLEVL